MTFLLDCSMVIENMTLITYESYKFSRKFTYVCLTFLFAENKTDTQKIIETKPLTIDHVRHFFHLSGRYPVPFCQQNVKVQSLILYTTKNREGAKDEANTLKAPLNAIGGKVEAIEWSFIYELKKIILDRLSRIQAKDDCSCLIVSVMCHGRRGMLQDNIGDMISIDTILRLLKDNIHAQTPLVCANFHCHTGHINLSICGTFYQDTLL